MPKTPEEMAASMIANLKEKTGKTLPQWLKLAKASKATKHGELVKWLKTEHGVTHGFANLIAHENFKAETASGDPIAAQYAGEKKSLVPIYKALIRAAKSFGKDVEVSPKKTYVSLRRKKQFALIQPSTKTRVDLGLNLKGTSPSGRLEAAGSFNAMCTHRVRLTSTTEVDANVSKWLKKAYDAAG
jgi:hypothetical protein